MREHGSVITKLFVLSFCCLALSISVRAEDDPTLGLRDSGFPLYKNVPTEETSPIAKVPKPFDHPRLFFEAKDLPRLRSLLLTKPSKDPKKRAVLGRGGYINLLWWLAGRDWNKQLNDHKKLPLFKGPFKKLLDDLLNDDGLKKPGSIDLSAQGLKTRYGAGVFLHATNVAENGFGSTGLYGKLSGAAFVSLISKNEEPFDAKLLGKALASTCRHHAVLWNANTPKRQNGTSFFHDSPDDLGTAYDWLYNDMSESDRKACRELIASMTGPERREIGTKYLKFPWMGYNWNWVGWHQTIVILAASIEGEHKNSNFTRWANDCNRVQSQYFMVESSEAGLANEGIGYHGLAMNGALPSTMISARTQTNLFEDPKTRLALHRMLLYRVYTIEPWIDNALSLGTVTHLDSFSHGDSPRPARPRAALVMRKYFPSDPLAAWHLRVSHHHINLYDPLMSAVFATDAEIATDKSSAIANYPNLAEVAEDAKLPHNFFCRDRGEMIVRDNWLPNATVFDFEVKMNALGLGHVHADRNSYYLYSRGRAWIIDNKDGDTENAAHQTVLIDGIGQGGGATPKGGNTFPSMPGIFLEYSEGLNSGIEFAAGAGDAKPAYDHAASCRMKEIKAEGFTCERVKIRRSKFVYPPAPYLNMPKFDGLSDKWMDAPEANTLFRNPIMVFNPVKKAFRSTLFAKTLAKSNGSIVSAPWMLIVDDIQKDDESHKYEHIINIPWSTPPKHSRSWQYKHAHEDVILDTKATEATKSAQDKIIKDIRDPDDRGPRLLVRVLRAKGMKKDGFQYFKTKEITVRGGNKALARQLIIEADSVSPDFCVFIYPHNLGDTLPETKWEKDESELVVSIPDFPEQTTRWKLKKTKSGRTKVHPMEFSTLPEQSKAKKKSKKSANKKKEMESKPAKKDSEAKKSPSPSSKKKNAKPDTKTKAKKPYMVAAQSNVAFSPRDGLRLDDVSEYNLCPVREDFSVICVLPDVKTGEKRTVQFFVGDSDKPIQTESDVPYSIAGDMDQKPHAWKAYPRERDQFGFLVRCKSSDGYEVRGKIGMDCGADEGKMESRDGDMPSEKELVDMRKLVEDDMIKKAKAEDESRESGEREKPVRVDMRHIGKSGIEEVDGRKEKEGGKEEKDGDEKEDVEEEDDGEEKKEGETEDEDKLEAEKEKKEGEEKDVEEDEESERNAGESAEASEAWAKILMDMPEMGDYEQDRRTEERKAKESMTKGELFLEQAWEDLGFEGMGNAGTDEDILVGLEEKFNEGGRMEGDDSECTPEDD